MKSEMLTIIEELRSFYKLELIHRFNTTFRIKNESVASHTFFVMLISRELCKKYEEKFHAHLDLLKIYEMGLIHDIPEMKLGDVTHEVKMQHAEIKTAIDNCEISELRKIFSADDGRSEYMYTEFTNNNNIETRIVHLADVLSVILYIENEMSLGNRNVESMYIDTLALCSKLYNEIFDDK